MRIRSSYIWAIIIGAGVIFWMVSDTVFPQLNEKQASADVEDSPLEEPEMALTVTAIKVKNEVTPIKIRGNGVTRTKFEIDVFARRSAFVEKVVKSSGSWVVEGAVLVELEKGTLNADIEAAKADRRAAEASYEDTKKRFSPVGSHAFQIRSAQANLEVNRKNYEVAKKLVERGVQTEIALIQKRALLRAAETRLFELKNISQELELANSNARLKMIDARILLLQEQLNFTNIIAPKRGWLESLNLETGEFIDENRPVARIIGLQSIILDLPIPQISVSSVKLGDNVEVVFAGLGVRIGIVKKISMIANRATRTFNVEVHLDNSDGVLRSGMSAEASIIVESIEALKISPAHLNVDNNGQLSVKTVDLKGSVKSIMVQLKRTTGNAAYISGLEDGTLLLTTGQAFLSEGEKVKYALAEDEE